MTSGGHTYRRPESVLVVIHTPELDCLLLERITPAGFWQSVTGTLEWDETPVNAARREVAEETGLPAAGVMDVAVVRTFPILPAWRARYAPEVSENAEHLFYLRVDDRLPVVLNPDEHRRYLWLPVREAATRASSWTNREALERLAGD